MSVKTTGTSDFTYGDCNWDEGVVVSMSRVLRTLDEWTSTSVTVVGTKEVVVPASRERVRGSCPRDVGDESDDIRRFVRRLLPDP